MNNLLSMKAALNKTRKKENRNLNSIELKQNALLEIYKDVFDACEKHGLKLFLQGGTLLGKVRHNGFIPWDDDMDLGLYRDDYDKLEFVYESELADKYTLQKPGYKDGTRTRFAQIYCGKKNFPDNIWIDIFPIDYVPDNKIKRLYVGVRCNMLMGIAGSIEFINSCDEKMRHQLLQSPIGILNYYIRKGISVLFSWRKLDKWYSVIEKTARNNKPAKYSTSSMGRWHYFGEMQKSNVFFPLKPETFCGVSAWTISDSKGYLTHNYGSDYMKVPSEEERESHG